MASACLRLGLCVHRPATADTAQTSRLFLPRLEHIRLLHHSHLCHPQLRLQLQTVCAGLLDECAGDRLQAVHHHSPGATAAAVQVLLRTQAVHLRHAAAGAVLAYLLGYLCSARQVSQNKRRYRDAEFDLDLTYVTGHQPLCCQRDVTVVQSASLPCHSPPAASTPSIATPSRFAARLQLFHPPCAHGCGSMADDVLQEVGKFFNKRHKHHYQIYNLCSWSFRLRGASHAVQASASTTPSTLHTVCPATSKSTTTTSHHSSLHSCLLCGTVNSGQESAGILREGPCVSAAGCEECHRGALQGRQGCGRRTRASAAHTGQGGRAP